MVDECEHGEPRGPGFSCPPCQTPIPTTPVSGWSAPFDARFPGRCAVCDRSIEPGDSIRFRTGEAIHDDCTEAP